MRVQPSALRGLHPVSILPLWCAGNQTQDLARAGQALYPLSYISNPIKLGDSLTTAPVATVFSFAAAWWQNS